MAEEDSEWNTSRIKGFSFADDDDEGPFEQLEEYRSISTSTENQIGGEVEVVVSFDPEREGPISDRVRRAIEQLNAPDPSIADIVSRSCLDLDNSKDPQKKLEAEVNFLRRQLEKVQLSKFTPLHPKETIRNIFLGKEVALEFYRSLDDKTALIDEAIDIGDGNAILQVTLFLRDSLKKSKFFELLQTRPIATRHLAVYLETRYELTDLIELYRSQGLYEEASKVEYKQAFSAPTLDQKIKRFKSVFSQQRHFLGHQDYIIEHINLLDRIAAIDATTVATTTTTDDDELFKSILDHESVLGATMFCSYHFWGVPENLIHSPKALHKMHKLSLKQITWISVVARAKKKAWADIEPLVITKGWLGGKKAKSVIDCFRLVNVLHENEAPAEVLTTYLQFVDSLEDRLNLAKKCKVHSIVVDVYVAQRDRVSLQSYRDSLVSRSREWFYADNALSVSNTRWKN